MTTEQEPEDMPETAPKKLEYRVLEGSYAADLQDQVTRHLLCGWELQGGVFLLQTPKVYAQAVAK